ncbi:flagellar biosynthesis protein FlhA [Spirochaeta lutea]|uniref:Flagellar biosynthesis protein FlhA n=1 Tax=Spirochaeta lutea TaxID=1480694 RepID=A0A098R055_9SPIO|nr:flagellar biosynthesis protein FlhA [Spirochaeta lutea]KGE73540.1 flagellar biosynthesis protein FlhA [Spirochaeta lutea]
MSDIPSMLGSAFLKDRSDALVAVGVVVVVMMLIIPLPTVLLDLFQSFNLIITLLILLIVLYTQRAMDFSIFPTILLVSTVFSLALNVSSTRLILAQGSDFGGQLVRAFGNFVVGTEGTQGLVIGIIIYIIVVAVQFLVITKGATRVAEVAARFTLDALPGKQMAIDQEYSSGLITEAEAQKRKSDLQKEVDFYGAMDGASKFVQGNVTVGILITVINIVGGMIVGMTLHGETLDVAVNTYISLTIGDGLISQFPALLVSTATGLIVTRSISDGTFGSDVTQQFSRQGRVYWIAAIFLLVLSFLPGFPWYVLLPMSIASGFLAYRLNRREVRREAEGVMGKKSEEEQAAADQSNEISPVAPLDPISLELGYGLVPLVDKDQGAELLERITKIRRESALDLGLVVPRIRIIDNMRLDPAEYCLKIRGVEVGRGMLRMGMYLSINPGGVTEEIPGEKTRDPAFGLPALWISEDQRDRAERSGYTVVDPPSIIATHLTELIKRHASEILGRQEVKAILDTLKKDYSAVVEEIQGVLGIGEVQKVLQGLLREQVSIRNMVAILETLADYGKLTKDLSFLIEKTRQALARQITMQYVDEQKTLHVITLEPSLEQSIIDSRLETAGGVVSGLPPDEQRRWINGVLNTVRSVQEQGYYPIILCQEAARPLVKESTKRDLPDLIVLSVPEIIDEIRVEGIAEIQL